MDAPDQINQKSFTEGSVQGSSSRFPDPPDHCKRYTDENIMGATPENIIVATQPPQPPPEPIFGTYTIFGESHDTTEPVMRTLESQGITRLYALDCDSKAELKKLHHSILANFLDLLEVLIRCPTREETEPKLKQPRDWCSVMTMYLEQYLDSLDSLPGDLRRNFSLMRDLDQRCQDSVSTLQGAVKKYTQNVADWNSERRNAELLKIQGYFDKAKSFQDDKVLLAQQTYDVVDKHIRRLDGDLARFEGELKQKIEESPNTSRKNARKNMEKLLASPPKKDKKELADEIPKISRKNKNKLLNEKTVGVSDDAISLCRLSGPALIQTLATAAGDVLDMPVDPNEPTYCLCQQVSYGEMIGCDNPDCPVEWYHFGCVNLSSKPKGKWYCPRCSEARKKK